MDTIDRDIVEILKRISRRPIDPKPSDELLKDLGFDSLEVLEFVGELEDRFKITVPLGDLAHVRSVGQIAAEVRKLAGHAEPAS